MSVRPVVSVVIVTYNRKEKLLRLLASVAASRYPAESLDVIVVDNGSTDGTVDAVRMQFPQVRLLLQSENLYSAGGRNVGIDEAKGDFIFFVDDDNILDSDCITRLAEAMQDDENLGIVAPLMMRYPEQDVIWCAGGRLSRFGLPYHLHEGKLRSELELPPIMVGMDYFPNSYMVRSFVFRDGIRHDTDSFPHNWNEQDLCARIKLAGFSSATISTAVTYHDVGYSTRITRIGPDKTFDQTQARVLYRRKYVNTFGQWAFFLLVLFPASTVYYMKVFLGQREAGFFTLLSAYCRGTWNGFRKKI